MHPYRLEDLFILKRVLNMSPWLSVNSGCCCLSLPGASGSIHLILQCMYCFRMQTSGRCRVQEEHPCFPGNGLEAMPGCSLFSNAEHFIVKSESCRSSTKHVKHMLESLQMFCVAVNSRVCSVRASPVRTVSLCCLWVSQENCLPFLEAVCANQCSPGSLVNWPPVVAMWGTWGDWIT